MPLQDHFKSPWAMYIATQRHRVLLAAGLMAMCVPQSVFGQPIFRTIDAHALKAPPEAETSVAKLAAYLVAPAPPPPATPVRIEAQKVRAIYRWMADRIAFNPDAEAAKKLGDATPEKVLETRLATAEGYSRLFQALCKEAGFETMQISGYLKNHKAKPSDAIKTNHVWNAVKITKAWRLIDVTLGAGAMNEETRKWEKRFDTFFYVTPHDRFIFSHFPDNPEHQFLEAPITAEQFAKRLAVPHELVRYVAILKDIQTTLDKPGFRGFVTANCDRDNPVTIVQVPLEKHLKKGETYAMRFFLPTYVDVRITSIEPILIKNGEEYFANVTPKAGPIVLSGVLRGKKWNVLEYEVED